MNFQELKILLKTLNENVYTYNRLYTLCGEALTLKSYESIFDADFHQ